MVAGLRDDLHHIAVLQLIAQRNNIAVHLGARALVADVGMDAVGEINGGGAFGKGLDISVRRENINVVRKQRHFEVGHEFPGILDILLNLQGFSQLFDLIVFVILKRPPFLVAPVGGNSFFRPLMHRPGPDLNFDPFAVGADHRRMQRLIVVGLGHGDVILEPPRDRLPQGMHDAERLIAAFVRAGIQNDAKRNHVVHFVKVDVLLMHFSINAV